MSKQTWRSRAREVIDEAYPEYRKHFPTLTDDEIMKKISREMYPWGRRENFAYKAWNNAIRDKRRAIGLDKPKGFTLSEMPLFGNNA